MTRVWRDRRGTAPTWVIGLLAVLLVAVATGFGVLPWPVASAALLGPVVSFAVLRAYPLVSLILGAAASVTLPLALTTAVPLWTAALGAATVVISVLAGQRMPHARPAMAVFAVALVASLFVEPATGALLLTVTVVLPWMAGRSLHQQARLAAAGIEQARLHERNRIARDMHDTLGHELSLLALRAGALELTVAEPYREAAADLRERAATAIARLAGIVTVLRDGEPAPLEPDSIEDLVERAARAGAPVTLEWHGSRALPPMAGTAAHRIVQEALTNAVKHAPGAPVRVCLRTADGVTTVTVSNRCGVRGRTAPGARAGLTGLRERARLAGGTLRAGPNGDDFEVEARLPHTEAP
ncbi:hypothetical protein Aca07nite_84190 [Actinoplanes capillaceus]|uniref:histidine kinase n=1 Tax=Actinoplanes campanulatus TaxID=113559 RepID=A0ABQ3WXZ2_9ACTN|nr:histidine kinase [Actinoplanes capillaceus]GID51144.1 hypothetical protein Aca07nite_84190 [Actinoplanes capillaceus]